MLKNRIRSSTTTFASVIGFLVAVLGGFAFAKSTGADRWWTPELDATTAAPGNHKVLFENDEVRVLGVTVAPGTREPMHVHRYPAVIYVDSTSHSRMISARENRAYPNVRRTPSQIALLESHRWLGCAKLAHPLAGMDGTRE